MLKIYTITNVISALQQPQYLQNIKHSRYIHLMWNFLLIHFQPKGQYVNMFDIVDTPFSYKTGLIVC